MCRGVRAHHIGLRQRDCAGDGDRAGVGQRRIGRVDGGNQVDRAVGHRVGRLRRHRIEGVDDVGLRYRRRSRQSQRRDLEQRRIVRVHRSKHIGNAVGQRVTGLRRDRVEAMNGISLRYRHRIRHCERDGTGKTRIKCADRGHQMRCGVGQTQRCQHTSIGNGANGIDLRDAHRRGRVDERGMVSNVDRRRRQVAGRVGQGIGGVGVAAQQYKCRRHRDGVGCRNAGRAGEYRAQGCNQVGRGVAQVVDKRAAIAKAVNHGRLRHVAQTGHGDVGRAAANRQCSSRQIGRAVIQVVVRLGIERAQGCGTRNRDQIAHQNQRCAADR